MTYNYYLSSPRMTVEVKVRDGLIVWTAPVVWRFRGQPLVNLTRWMKADVVERIGEEI